MDFIFNKDDNRKLELFSYLENSHSQSASIKEIKEHFEWSTFLTTTAIEELNNDITGEGLDRFFLLTIENKQVTLHKNGLDSIDHLILLYGQQSPQFKMLDYLLKTNGFKIEEFADQIFLSESKAYRTKYGLSQSLEDYDLEIDADLAISGPEQKIRIFFYHLYATVFKNYLYPFDDEMNQLSNEITTQIFALFNFTPTHTQLLKLKYYLSVTLERLRLEHTFPSEETIHYLVSDNPQVSLDALTDILSQTHYFETLTPQQQENEADALLNFLFMEEFIEAQIKDKTLTQNIEQLNAVFITNLEAYFSIQLEDKELAPIRLELNRVHFNQFYNYSVAFSWHSLLNDSILKENYNIFYDFTDKLQESLLKQKVLKLSGSEQNYWRIRSQYIYLLIRFIDTQEVIQPVHVTIDFSYGKSYNELIYKNLKSLPFFNIIVNYHLNEETDIYLSDFLMANVESRYLIWSNPPIASDWEIFANLLVDIRANSKKTVGEV